MLSGENFALKPTLLLFCSLIPKQMSTITLIILLGIGSLILTSEASGLYHCRVYPYHTTCRSPNWFNSYKIGYSVHHRGHERICCYALGCGRPVVAGTRITGHCPNPRYYWIGCSDGSIFAIMPWTNGPWMQVTRTDDIRHLVPQLARWLAAWIRADHG